MRYTKGKWVASNKDTWSVDATLNKIIHAYIQKLYNGLKGSKCHGVPMYYVNKQAVIEGLVDNAYEADVDAADLLRLKDLEELLWVFGTEEPDVLSYDFDIEMVRGEPNEKGNIPITFLTTGVNGGAEKERYHKDCEAYTERKLKGYELFGKIYNTLDW